MKIIDTKNEKFSFINIIHGIAYIIWILTAWTLVSLCRFVISTQHVFYISNLTSALFKELIRFFVFIGPIILFIIHNIKKPWPLWLGLYGYKKNAPHKTIVISAIYTTISIFINMLFLKKNINLSAISPIFLATTFSFSIIMEEIAFRGFLFYLFEKWNKNIVVVITSLAFAAKHLPGWLFFPSELSTLGLIGDFSMVFIVGCILGYLYLATHSIWSTSIVHSINNLIVALFS